MTNNQAHVIARYPLAVDEILWTLASALRREPPSYVIWSNPAPAHRFLLGIGHTREEAWQDASTQISKLCA